MWVCPECKEENEEAFDVCWNCLTFSDLNTGKKNKGRFNKKVAQKNKDFLTREHEELDIEPDSFNKTFSVPVLYFFKYDINMSYLGLIQQFLLRLIPAIFFIGLIYFFEKKMSEEIWILLFIPMGIALMATIFASFGFLIISIRKFFNNSK